METEKDMDTEPKPGVGDQNETEAKNIVKEATTDTSSATEEIRKSPLIREQKIVLTPEERNKFLEDYDLENLKRLPVEEIDKRIENMIKGQQPGREKPLKPKHHYETIKNQFLQDVQVEWPNNRQEAEKWIRGILGEIEISKDEVDQQIQIDYKNANDILEVLSRKTEDINWKTGESMNSDEISDQQKWAKKMRGEIKARLKLHASFMKYESEGSVKAVHEAMLGLYGGWLNAVFELKETSSKTQEEFNPFVEALQFYEDHGHEFARHNSESDRDIFGERVMDYLSEKFGGDAKNYKWASNMAERLFRATGRATMYDYLVINKDKEGERMVSWDYDGPEKTEWASGRDGCDYPMSKIYRFRENLKAEEGLMRGQIELLDGADILAGDFWTRTVQDSYLKLLKKEPIFTYRNKDQEEIDRRIQILEKRLKEQYLLEGLSAVKTKEEIDKAVKKAKEANFIYSEPEKDEIIRFRKEELMKKNEELTEEQALIQANKYYEDIYQADLISDRPDDNNFGEVVGKINFKLMQRKLEKNEKGDEVLVSGIDFIKMGATPMSLWVSRMLDGPESAKDPLSGSREAYLLNPNFKTLAKLIGCFDYSKANTWKVKEQLIKNYIRYATSDAIEANGRPRLSDEEIIAGVNELAGLTDPNAPQFIQMPERTKILKEYLKIEISEEEEAKIKAQALEQATNEIRIEKPGLPENEDEFKKAVDVRATRIARRKVDYMINSKIAYKQNIKFAKSFIGEGILGAAKGGLKQFLAELGLK